MGTWLWSSYLLSHVPFYNFYAKFDIMRNFCVLEVFFEFLAERRKRREREREKGVGGKNMHITKQRQHQS